MHLYWRKKKKKKSIETVYHKVILKHTWRW